MDLDRTVIEISDYLSIKKRDVYLALSSLGYIVNQNNSWGFTDIGIQEFTFAKLPKLVSDVRREFESEQEQVFTARRVEQERKNKKIECDWCHELKHPAYFGPNGVVCTPCYRRYFARRNRRSG